MINKALFTEQIRRFWAIPAFATLLYLLTVYAPLIGGTDDWWSMQQLVSIVTMGNSTMLLIMVATPVITAFCMFGCFFNKRAATVFYSLPISKNQLFVTNACAGIVLSFIPVALFCLVLLLPLGFHASIDDAVYLRAVAGRWPVMGITFHSHVPIGALPGGIVDGAVINSLPVIASLFMRMVIATVFYFGVAWLAFSLAGHGLIALLVVGVMPFVPFVLVSFSDFLGIMFIFGYQSTIFRHFLEPFLAFHNPAAWGLLIRPGELNHTQAVIIPTLVYIVIGAAIYAGAFAIVK
jgi:hypothetical protein